MNTRIPFAGAALLCATLSAFADVKVNDNISINGYAVGSYAWIDPDGGKKTESVIDSGSNNLDSVKVGVLGTSGQISGYASLLYIPNAANEAGLLDAYATFDAGGGFKVTGGKFLSYLGYEAFDPINMNQLTYGSTIFAIPAYHTGARLDYSSKTFSAGVAAVDSVFSGRKGFFEGDREYSDDVGFEAQVTYTGIEKLTVFAGIAYEDSDADSANPTGEKVKIFDLWASYAVNDKLTIAGEFDTQDNVGDGWLAFASYKFTPQVTVAARISGANYEDARGDELKYTIAPTVTINSNFAVRAEISKVDADFGDATFFGIQGVFKF